MGILGGNKKRKAATYIPEVAEIHDIVDYEVYSKYAKDSDIAAQLQGTKPYRDYCLLQPYSQKRKRSLNEMLNLVRLNNPISE